MPASALASAPVSVYQAFRSMISVKPKAGCMEVSLLFFSLLRHTNQAHGMHAYMQTRVCTCVCASMREGERESERERRERCTECIYVERKRASVKRACVYSSPHSASVCI